MALEETFPKDSKVNGWQYLREKSSRKMLVECGSFKCKFVLVEMEDDDEEKKLAIPLKEI